MEIHHLRYFTTVAEELHFGRAARRLHMSRPPLSQRIADLEHELGVRLFTRTNRSVRLTRHGHRLLPLATEVLRAFDTVIEKMALPNEFDRTLSVAFLGETSRNVLRALQYHFAEQPVHLDWSEASTADQREAILAGGLDLGVLYLPIEAHGLWVSPPLCQSLGVVTSPEHPLADDQPIPLSALHGQTLFMFSRSRAPGLYDDTLATCIAHGFRPRTVIQGVRWYHSLRVESELSSGGIVLAPRTWADQIRGVVWRPIEGEPLVWETAVCCRHGEEHDGIMQAAIHTVLEALQEHDQWRAPM